jgi:hypothetical protein
MDLGRLKAEFPRAAISWRAQSVTKDGSKAMALAYIDARDVMNRLDEACGPDNWQDEYTETTSGRLICRIGIRVTDDWVWKSDGAGDTDVEGEKGAISGAFKRAAVKWGIGRYLYDMPAPWVPCESYQGNGGKFTWKSWKEDPWKYVKGAPVYTPPAVPLPHDLEPLLPDFVAQCRDQHGGGEGFVDYVATTFAAAWKRCKTPKQMENALAKHRASLDWIERESADAYAKVIDAYETHMLEITGNFERAAQ